MFEYTYKNIYEELNINDILNNQGQSLQSFILKSNNPSFSDLINKFRRIDDSLNKQLLVSKEMFHSHLMNKIQFDTVNFYPLKIDDPFLIMN